MRKTISLLIAASLSASVFVCTASAANTSQTVTAGDLTVTNLGTAVTGPEGFAYGSSSSNPQYGAATAAKKQGVYGLAQNEYGLEMIAGRQKADQPYLAFDFGDIDASADFYVTTNVYVGVQPQNGYIRLGTKLTKSDGSELKNGDNFQGYKFFQGGGAVRYVSNVADGSLSKQNASYTTNNWINYTIAGTGGEIAVYVDGVKFNTGWVSGISGGNKTVSYSGILKNVSPTIRFESYNGNLGDAPSVAVLKDMKLVAGTYNPEQSKTTITSNTYTVPNATLLLGSSVENIAAVKPVIKNIPADTTATTFLSNITVLSGATKKVVSIDAVDKSTTEVTGSAIVTSDMKLLVTAADGAMKLYDLDAAISAANAPSITSSLTRYAIDDANKTITMPNTTVEKLTSVVTGTNGTTVAVKDSLGDTVASGTVRDSYKLVATKNGVEYEYSPVFSTPTKVLNLTNALNSIADDTLLLSATRTSDTAFTKTYAYADSKGLLPGFTGTNGEFFSKIKNGQRTSYEVYKRKIPGTTIDAYNFTYPVDGEGNKTQYAGHKVGNLFNDTKNSIQADKMVINFKLYIPSSGGMFTIVPRHTVDGSGAQTDDIQTIEAVNATIGDRITFQTDGKVYLGGLIRSGGYAMELTRITSGTSYTYGKEIATYSKDTLYDVTIVQSRGTWASGVTVVTEGVYLNGINKLSSPNTTNITNGKAYNAIREIDIATAGTSYMSGLNIYMTDNYDPSEYVVPTPAAASLAITSNTVTIDSTNKVITGWDGMTAAQLKAAITASDAKAEISVMNVEGDGEIGDSSPVEPNMLLMVKDKYYGNAEYYLLFCTVRDTGTIFTVANGNITATRTISVYNDEATQYNRSLIIAGYNKDNGDERLYNADIMKKNIRAADAYDYSVSIPYVQGYTYKAFWWNMTDDSNVPIEPATTYVP